MNDENSIQDSVKDAISERISNPFIGSFVVAWCITNWEFLAILVRGEAKIEDRIVFLKASYMSISKMVYIPAISALLVVIVYPWLSFLVMRIRRYPAYLIKTIQFQEEIRIAQLRGELAEEKMRYRKIIKKSDEGDYA